MNAVFILWSSLLIGSLSIMGLAIRHLAVSGVPLSESLVLRGFVSLVMVVTWARVQKMSLKPKSIKTQTIRAFIAGLALTFFSLSYNWLSASTISVLSNIDVPLIVILGALVGQSSSSRAKLLSAVSILFLILYGLKVQGQPRWILGLTTLMIGLFLLCFGYYFIKKSMTEENKAITILTPSLAIIVYGLLQIDIVGDVRSVWTTETIRVGIISGIGMFGAYYTTMKLYEQTDIATAEFPALISSLAIQPLELVFFNEPMSAMNFLLTLAFIVCTYFILNADKPQTQSNYETGA